MEEIEETTTYTTDVAVTQTTEHRATITVTDSWTHSDGTPRSVNYTDILRATWVAVGAAEGWWNLSGDNAGAGNGMIVHDYMIEPLIELLQTLKGNSN